MISDDLKQELELLVSDAINNPAYKTDFNMFNTAAY